MDRPELNPFFDPERRNAAGKFRLPQRLYARRIDGGGKTYLLFDAVDASWFDAQLETANGSIRPERWKALAGKAKVFAVEIDAGSHGGNSVARRWLAERSGVGPRWVELHVSANPEGPADIFDYIAGPAQPANLKVSAMSAKVRQAIKMATDLTPSIASNSDIEQALPTAPIHQVFVLDVGQGSANALVKGNGDVVGYVDLGAGVLSNVATWPSGAMKGICIRHSPTVLLTHWHYDHFDAANRFTGALNLTWIAPFQILGPGPQSVMASTIAALGKLLVWNGHGRLGASGPVEIERCSGSTQNRSGLAVWVNGPKREAPILLPGDAGYVDISSLSARAVTAFAVAHHGGLAAGTAPKKPASSLTGLAMSYGHGNTHKHPLVSAQSQLTAVGWHLGPFPGTKRDERRTEDRPGGTGAAGLGHIRLRWAGSVTPTRSCPCGCTVDPTQ